jgi:16S rRNA (guanine(966)-N(2))-methyltransferase RsmD
MRVIAGRFKGTKLFGADYADLRPLTDRAKESIFGIIQEYLPDARVLDLYAGTGAFGIEALSRGARQVVFVEISPFVVRILKRNLTRVRCEPKEYSILTRHVEKALPELSQKQTFDIIFADPPFRTPVAVDLLNQISKLPILRKGGLFIYRHHQNEDVPSAWGKLEIWREKKYGDSVVKFFVRE